MRTPPINRLPRGLLSFFGIKSAGRNPQVLTEELLPTLDLQNWYDEGAMVEAQVDPIVFNTNPVGGSLIAPVSVSPVGTLPPTLICPQNEVWKVKVGSGVRWRFAPNATPGHCRCVLATQLPGPVTPFYRPWPMQEWGEVDSRAAALTEGGAVLFEELWVHPNEQIRILVARIEGIAVGDEVTLEANLSIVRLRV